jgi:hypothetical protein
MNWFIEELFSSLLMLSARYYWDCTHIIRVGDEEKSEKIVIVVVSFVSHLLPSLPRCARNMLFLNKLLWNCLVAALIITKYVKSHGPPFFRFLYIFLNWSLYDRASETGKIRRNKKFSSLTRFCCVVLLYSLQFIYEFCVAWSCVYVHSLFYWYFFFPPLIGLFLRSFFPSPRWFITKRFLHFVCFNSFNSNLLMRLLLAYSKKVTRKWLTLPLILRWFNYKQSSLLNMKNQQNNNENVRMLWIYDTPFWNFTAIYAVSWIMMMHKKDISIANK